MLSRVETRRSNPSSTDPRRVPTARRRLLCAGAASPSARPRGAASCSRASASVRAAVSRAGARACCGAASTRRAARWRRRLANGARPGRLPRGSRRLPAAALAAGRRRPAAVLRDVLRPIEGRGADGEELLRSLEAFLEHNGNWEAAARALFCHRHTLRYRMARVEELTGRASRSRREPHRVLAGAARRELRRAAPDDASNEEVVRSGSRRRPRRTSTGCR